jgi:hypothetical protein
MVDVLAEIANSKRSVYRLQTLARYNLGGDEQELKDYQRGVLLPERAENSWLETIRGVASSGRTFTNLHILPAELGTYLKYSIEWWYIYWAKAGANMRFLKTAIPLLTDGSIEPSVISDHWLIDDERLIFVAYDQQGVSKGVTLEQNCSLVEAAVAAKNALLNESWSLEELLSRLRGTQVSI